MWVFREFSRLAPDEEKKMRTKTERKKNTERYASVLFGADIGVSLIVDAMALERNIKK